MTPSRIGLLLGLAILLATLLNGTPYLLKKTGVLERDRYDYYWSDHCRGGTVYPNPFLKRCDLSTKVWEKGMGHKQEVEYLSYLYEAKGWERYAKLAKDALFGGLILLSAGLMARRWMRIAADERCHLFKRWHLWGESAWPLLLGLGLLILDSLVTLGQHGPLLVAAGWRTFTFLLLALLGGWLAGRETLQRVAWALLILSLVQCALIPLELAGGVHLHGHTAFIADMPKRFSGAMVMPNTLGIYAVLALAFWERFLESKSVAFGGMRKLGIAATVFLVLVSGSIAGLGALLLYLAVRTGFSLRRWHLPRPWIAPLALLLVVGVVLIAYSRKDPYSTLTGRLETLFWLLDQMNGWEWIKGMAVGAGTNAALNFLPAGGDPRLLFVADSTFSMLIAQLGLPGALGFYAILRWAVARDPDSIPFYLLVAILSFGMNLTEVFPVNLLLGLALAHAAFESGGTGRFSRPAGA